MGAVCACEKVEGGGDKTDRTPLIDTEKSYSDSGLIDDESDIKVKEFNLDFNSAINTLKQMKGRYQDLVKCWDKSIDHIITNQSKLRPIASEWLARYFSKYYKVSRDDEKLRLLIGALIDRYFLGLRNHIAYNDHTSLGSPQPFIDEFVDFTVYPVPGQLEYEMNWKINTPFESEAYVKSVLIGELKLPLRMVTRNRQAKDVLPLIAKYYTPEVVIQGDITTATGYPLEMYTLDEAGTRTIVEYSGCVFKISSFAEFLEAKLSNTHKTRKKVWDVLKKNPDSGNIESGTHVLQLMVALAAIYTKTMEASMRKKTGQKKAKIEFSKVAARELLRPVVAWMVRYKMPTQKFLDFDNFTDLIARWLHQSTKFFANTEGDS